MELLPLVCVSLLTWSGTTFAAENEPKVIRVKEGGSIILPCSLSSKQDISSQLFDWRKDHRKADEKQVFQYNGRDPSNIIITSEDERVSHFPDELKSGDASITIRNTKVADSGNYTCIFPDLNPEQIFHIKLVVGSASKPSLKRIKTTNDGEALLQCETHGNPQPELLWQDSDGNNLKAEEPLVSKQGDQFYVTLQITVYKTGDYRCVATQEEIQHQINDTTHVTINEQTGLTGGQIAGIFFGTLAAAVGSGIVGYKQHDRIRSLFRNDASPKPSVRILDLTLIRALLQCEVQGAFPKPELHWEDRAGNKLPAEETLVSDIKGLYDIILKTTVYKTDRYRCVATQEEINHQTHADIDVDMFADFGDVEAGLPLMTADTPL